MRIEKNVALAPYTTFKIGGPADYFCCVKTKKDLEKVLSFCLKKKLSLCIFGGGSNILVSDSGFRGLVVQLDFRGRMWRDREGGVVEVTVAAGEPWDTLVEEAVQRNVYGIENLSGIPGSVGGTPIQNVGAYGMEVGEVIVRVGACNRETLAWREFSAKECKFGYRDSFFKTDAGRMYIVTDVTFRLEKKGKLNIVYKDVANYFKEKKETPTLASVRKAILEIRSRKFPDLAAHGTAGSFFKNPIVSKSSASRVRKIFSDIPQFDAPYGKVKLPAAWLIEHVGGWKGIKLEDVGSFQNQALVIVNYGKASAQNVKKFGDTIIEDIFSKCGIRLEREVQLVGDFL